MRRTLLISVLLSLRPPGDVLAQGGGDRDDRGETPPPRPLFGPFSAGQVAGGLIGAAQGVQTLQALGANNGQDGERRDQKVVGAPFQSPPACNSQCPCSRPKSSAVYIGYDIDYQATTVEEAIINFRELRNDRNDDPNPFNPLGPGKKNRFPYVTSLVTACTTDDCKRCAKFQLQRLRSIAESAGSAASFVLHQIDDLSRRLGLDKLSKLLKPECSWMIKKTKHAPVSVAPDTNQLNDLMRLVKGPVSRPRRDTHDEEYQSVMDLECRNRGEPIDDVGDWVTLCAVCSQMGILQQNYFPPFVNQAACTKNTRCLSGYGECRPRLRSMQVLKNVGSSAAPKWEPHTISAPVACECQLKPTSALVNLARN